MADNVSATPAAPAATQPAPSQPAPVQSPGSVGSPAPSSGVDDKAVEFFGYRPPPGTSEPAVSESPAQTPSPTDPAQAGHSEADKGAAVEGTATTPPAGEELPGDDILKEFETLAAPKAGEPQVPKETSDAAPDIEKIANPDGKVAADDFKTRLQHAQSYIGQQHKQYGEKVKELSGQLGELIQSSKAVEQMFARDDKGQVTGVKPEAVLQMFDLADQTAMEAAIAARGQKLVPIDAKVEGVGEDAVVELWEREWINNAVPDKELTLAEKRAQIESDPALSRKMLLAENRFLSKREADQATHREREQRKTDDYNRNTKKLYDQFLGEIEKHPDYKDVYAPALAKIDNLLGPTAIDGKVLPGALKGANRIEVIKMMLQFYRIPKLLKDVREKAIKYGQDRGLGVRQLMAVPGSGGAPQLQAGTGRPGGNGDVAEAEAFFGARADRG